MKSLKRYFFHKMIVVIFILFVVNFVLRSLLISYVSNKDVSKAEFLVSIAPWTINQRESLIVSPIHQGGNYTPLIVACRNGDSAMVEMLISHGANPNKRDNTTDSYPLFELLRGDHQNRFKLSWMLINDGADIYDTDLLFLACDIDGGVSEEINNQSFEIVIYFIEKGVPLENEDYDDRYYGFKLIRQCIVENNICVLEYLLERKYYSPNEKGVDREGHTALTLCIESGNIDACRVLLDFGADPYLKDENNKSPIDYALDGNNLELIELLSADN